MEGGSIDKYSFILRLASGLTAGIGAVVLSSQGIISGDAAVAILSALIVYFIGETNGQIKASKPS